MNRHFRLYWIGAVFAQLGLSMGWVALPWYVLKETQSAPDVGLILAANPLAQILTSTLMGSLLDKWPRKVLMVSDNLGQFVLYAIVATLAMTAKVPFPILLLLILLSGCLSPISLIGRGIMLPNLVSIEDLPKANAMTQLRVNFVTLVGPALGGMLVGFLGAPGTFLVSSICFFIYVGTLLLIPRLKYGEREAKTTTPRSSSPFNFLRSMGEGWIHLYGVRILFVLAIITLFFNLTYGPLEPAMPVLIVHRFHASASMLGFTWSAFAIGVILGTLLWGKLNLNWPVRWLTSGVIICWGIANASIGIVHHAVLAMVWLFFGGFTYASYGIVYNTLQQKLIPDDVRGKVYGAMSTIVGVGLPVGQLLGGLLIAAIGAAWTPILGGIACIALGILVVIPKRWWAEPTSPIKQPQSQLPTVPDLGGPAQQIP